MNQTHQGQDIDNSNKLLLGEDASPIFQDKIVDAIISKVDQIDEEAQPSMSLKKRKGKGGGKKKQKGGEPQKVEDGESPQKLFEPVIKQKVIKMSQVANQQDSHRPRTVQNDATNSGNNLGTSSFLNANENIPLTSHTNQYGTNMPHDDKKDGEDIEMFGGQFINQAAAHQEDSQDLDDYQYNDQDSYEEKEPEQDGGQGDKQNLKGPQGEEDDDEIEQTPLTWALQIGAPKSSTDKDFIQEQLKPQECDVYPLSVSYTKSEKWKMKIIRILSLIVCFYITVPFDLYITSHNRIHYFGTDRYMDMVRFEDIDSNYTFQLQNCKLYMKPSGNTLPQFQLEYGFTFKTPFTFNSSILDISADTTESCIINLFLPTNVSIPKLVFNMTGTQDNILFNDYDLNGQALNFSNGMEIYGDVAYITLHNHYFSYINISMKFATVNFNYVTSKLKNISLITGYYNEKIDLTVSNNYVSLNQPNGHICVYGPKMNQTTNNTCVIIQDPASYSNTSVPTCSINTYVCNSSKSNCLLTNPYNAQQYINVTVTDGPIQIKYDVPVNTTYPSIYQEKSSYQFAAASFYSVNTSNTNFISDTATDRIAILQTLGINYEKAWMYTNKLPIIEAQYWPLAWGSIGLLRPQMDYMKLIIMDYKCPARPSSILTDREINDVYYNIFPQSTISKVAFIVGYSNFWVVTKNDFGDTIYSQIKFNQNNLIVTCFAIAATIAFVGALFGVQLSFMLLKILKKKYNVFVMSQKQLAITKKQATDGAQQSASQTQNIANEFEGLNKIVEIRGLCSTQFVQMEPEEIARQKLKFNFSLYQIPALVLDYIFKKKINNSLVTFLNNIAESKYQFTNKKMKQTNKTEVSMLLSQFQAAYSDFCQRNGYSEISVEKKGVAILKKYNITIVQEEDKKQQAYLNIRFKTPKEKIENELEETDENSVRYFLKSECVFSSFENDYLFFDQIRQAYYNFCNNSGIQESQQEQIIGSDEMTSFGCIIKEMPPPKTLLGIKKGKSENTEQSKICYPGIVRRPANMKTTLINKFMAVDGLVPNFILCIVVYICILIVPLVTPIITFLALCEMTRLSSDIYQRKLSFFDFYTTNRMDPWWDNTPYIKEAAYCHIYVIVYLVFAFVELVSFFMTGYDNNGKFPVKYTPIKRIIMITFYVLLGIFIFYYVAMLWFALVWCLLAAILNPSKFLPYTAAALAFIGTIAAKIVLYKLKYQMTIKSYERRIAAKVGQMFAQALQKVKSQTSAIASKIPGGNKIMSNSLNSQLGVKAEGGANPENLDLSDAHNLAKTASTSLDGLNPSLIELSTAIIIKDKARIQEIVVAKLSHELAIDPRFLSTLSSLILCDFNPQKTSKQLAFGVTELAIKKLFSTLFPELNIDLFDKLISLVLEKDPTAIISLLKNIDGIDTQIFEIMTYIKFKDRDRLKSELFKLYQKLLGEQNKKVYEIFQILHDLREGEIVTLLNEQSNLVDGDNQIAGSLGFQFCFTPLSIIAFNQRSSTLDSIIMTQSLKEIMASQQLMTQEEKDFAIKNFNTHKQTQSLTEQLFLGFFYIIKGESIDMKRLAATVKRSGNINGDMMEILHQCSQNSIQSFEQVLFKLNCTQNKDILMEFYQIMQKSKTKFMAICNKLFIPDDSRDTFTNLIYLLYRIIKYDILIQQNKGQEKSLNFLKDLSILRSQIKESLDEIQDQFEDIDYSNLDEIKDLQMKFKNALEKKFTGMFKDRSKMGVSILGSGFASQIQSKINAPQIAPSEGPQQYNNIPEQQDDGDDKKTSQDIKQLIKIIFSEEEHDKKYHLVLWQKIIERPQLKIFATDDVLAFIRCHAFVLLKNDKMLAQNDPAYIKCYQALAPFYEIQEERFELLIDIIGGDPREIFKVLSKIEYSIKQETNFKGSFDQRRLLILSQILQARKTALTTACLNWYHQYRYFQDGKQSLLNIMKIFKINKDFMEILSTRRLTQSEDNADLYQKQYCKQIWNYLKNQIKSKANLPSSRAQDNNYSTECTISEGYFANENDKQDDKNVSFIKEVEVMDREDKGLLLEIMERLIDLKSYERNMIAQMLKTDKDNAFVNLFKSYLEVIDQNTPHGIMNVLQKYSECIPIFQESDDWYVTKSINAKDKILFIQLNMILHASQIQILINKNDMNVYLMNKELTDMVQNINESKIQNNEVYYIEDRDFRKCLVALFDNSYFQEIALKLFGQIYGTGTDEKKTCNKVLGLLLGSALDDRQLLRQSIMALLKEHDLKAKILEGIIAVLMSDIDAIDSIKALCTQLEIDGDLLVKLMDLTDKNSRNLPAIIIELLRDHDEEQSKLCTSLLYTMKGDLSMVKVMSQKLGIEPTAVIPLLAAAQGNFSMLKEFYQYIQDKLSLSSQKAVRNLLQLAHGDSQCIYQLSQSRSQNFQIYSPELVDAMYTVTFIGKRMFTRHTNIRECEQLRKLDNSLNKITEKMSKILKLDPIKANNLNRSLKILVKSCWNDPRSLQTLYKKLVKNTDKGSIWQPQSSNPDQLLLTEFYTEKEIIKFLSSCLRYICEDKLKLEEMIEQKQREMIKYLKNTLLPQIKKLYTGKDDADNKPAEQIEENKEEEKKKKEEEEKKKKEEEEKKKKEEEDALLDKKGGATKEPPKKKRIWQFRKPKELSEEDKFKMAIGKYYNLSKSKEDDVISGKIKDNLQQMSFQIGCTFGLCLHKMVQQPLFYCETCNENAGEDNLGICIICAQFCHAGHKIVEASYGENTRSVCDCGAGRFNKCESLNNNNPIQEFREKKGCSVLRYNIINIQETAIKTLNEMKKKKFEQSEDDFEIYKEQIFLRDLSRALQLPQYFGFDKEIETDYQKFVVKKNGLTYLHDQYLKQDISLAENLILLSYGAVTNSFVTLIGNKKSFTPEDYTNQSQYKDPHSKSQNLDIYDTMSCFIAIAQNNFNKVQQFGIGLAQVLGEKGSKELTAEDKFSNILRLANGGKIPAYDPDLGSSSQPCRNSYARLFQQLFGINGKSIMALHYMLTLSRQQLIDAMGFKMKDDDDDNDGNQEENSGASGEGESENQGFNFLQNLLLWVDEELFSNFLQMTDKSIEYCKNIIGIYCKHEKAFDFIATEKDIGIQKSLIYKALLFSKKERDLTPVYQKIQQFVPVQLNLKLRRVCKGEIGSIIEFLVKYQHINNQMRKQWNKVNDFHCKTDIQIRHFRYLQTLYLLMTGDTMDQERQLEYIYERIYHQKLVITKSETIKNKPRIMEALMSVAGILYNDNIQITRLANALNVEGLTKEIFESITQIINNQWIASDIKKFINFISGKDITKKQVLSYSKTALLATEGDLVALCKLEDDIFLGNKTHLRSLLASMITGLTKFDNMLEGTSRLDPIIVQQYKNLLKREIYRIYEKIARFQYKDTDKKERIEPYLKFCFDQKVPLHLLMLLSQDRNFVQKLFDATDEFQVNLTKSKSSKNKKFLKTMIDFMNPYNNEAQLNMLLYHVLKDFRNVKLTIKKLENTLDYDMEGLSFESAIITKIKDKISNDNSDSFEVDLIDLTQMFYNCFSLDQRATSYIYNYLAKIFDNVPILSNILQILQALIDGRPIFDNLHAIVVMILASTKKELSDEIDFTEKEVILIKQITLWMESIMLMLNKDKSQNIQLIGTKFKELFKGLIEYYGDSPKNPFAERKDNILYIVDAIIGLMSILKGDFANMKSLAIKLGGFPVQQKMDSFFKMVRDNKNSIKFSSISSGLDHLKDLNGLANSAFGALGGAMGPMGGNAQVAGALGGAQDAVNQQLAQVQGAVTQVAGQVQSGINTAQQILGDDPIALLTNPKLIFERFTNKRGTMSFEDFSNFIRLIGLPISHAKMLQIFSAADVNKTGELNIDNFKQALAKIQNFLVMDNLNSLGLSVTDLIISFAFSIVILLLMFAFIFVGIEAFAPSSSFSSVTNTALPLVAGGSVNSKGGEAQSEDAGAADANVIEPDAAEE